jgi:RimJ/RimL family protein N-acetyltransferase
MQLRPEYPIVTDRLRLRPLTTADVDALLTYRGRADVCRYLPFEPMTPEVLLGRLRTDLSRTVITLEGQALTLGVELTETGQLIGDLVLFFRSREHAGESVCSGAARIRHRDGDARQADAGD